MTLVLIHCSAADASVWDSVREHLFGIPVLAPDLPGRRAAQPPADEWLELAPGVDAYAASILRDMDQAGVERATIAGHSLGGAVALWLALHWPERVAGLGLVGAGARLRVKPEIIEGLQDGLREVADLMAAVGFAHSVRDRYRVAMLRMIHSVGASASLADFRACDRFDVMEGLREVRCPTRVLVGTEDLLTPPKYSAFLAERISGARLTEYPGAGHMLPWERPAEVAGELAVLWAATSRS